MTQANQVQIPTIQTPDNSLNQVQQNVNKVFRNLNNQISDLQSEVGELLIVGEVKFANLTLLQFQSVAGIDWVACDGSNCIGTQYSLLTGNKVLPNIAVTGTNAFIKVN